MVEALVIRAPGTNCDRELADAFTLAGARATTVHLDRLAAEPERLEAIDLVGLPGGFSFGDDIGAGAILALHLRERLLDALRGAIERGVPMIAPCNGFQVLARMGLLPGDAASTRPEPVVTLAPNDPDGFIDDWVAVSYDADSPCVWTRGLADDPDEIAMLPVAHGEGRFVTDQATLDRLAATGQVVVRYRAGENPNGSMGDVAGICDPSGLVLGLMPHPERYVRWTAHPTRTRLPDDLLGSHRPPGLRMFRNAVAHASARRGARAV